LPEHKDQNLLIGVISDFNSISSFESERLPRGTAFNVGLLKDLKGKEMGEGEEGEGTHLSAWKTLSGVNKWSGRKNWGCSVWKNKE
jgi:hypothetical protein